MIVTFLREILGDEPLRLPEDLDNLHAEVISELRGEFRDLDELGYSLDDDSPESVACQLHQLFPSHCLKCLRALSEIELESARQGGQANLLGWPSATLVDIGCGAGAASAALLALLQSYQQFLVDHGRRISPVRVLLIGFDPSPNMLALYRRVIGQYSQLASEWLLDVRVEELAQPFPQGVWDLTRHYRPENAHFALVVMSNVVRPLGDSFRIGRSGIWEKIRSAVAGEQVRDAEFGEAEGRAIRLILEDWALHRLGLLTVATYGHDRVTGTQWHNHLDQMTKEIEGRASPHKASRRGVTKRTAAFENPSGSWWRTCRGRVGYETTYYFDWLTITQESYYEDKQWQSVAKPANLELAWARARRHALHEALVDEVEIRLFDREPEENLDRLRKQVMTANWRALNVDGALPFDAPKKKGETRPKALTRVQDQILSAAIIQTVGAAADQYRKASFSYRLNDRRDEFLYRYWLGLWKGFLTATHRNVRGRSVLRSDVTRFYEKVEQDTLMGVVKRMTGIRGLTENLLSALLLRDCGPSHDTGRGLPQGHVASGFWADLYLAESDKVLSTLPGVLLARYADDMVLAIDERIADPVEVKRLLRITLDELGGLKLSKRKTVTQTGGQYLSETALDDVLSTLDEHRFKPLINALYRPNRAYRALYRQSPWAFVADYRRLLEQIPVYMSEPWLRRKLEQHSTWRDMLLRRRLRFPEFPESAEGSADWLSHFVSLNARWMEALDLLRGDLVALCEESASALCRPEISGHQRITARRRLRFAAYRLCVLGLNRVADLLSKQIVRRPCTVPVQAVCRSLGLCGGHELLTNILDASESAYVRACAIRALADVRPSVPESAIARMWTVLNDPSAARCEKMKASEALLFVDRWDAADREVCSHLVEGETDPYLLKNYVLMMSRAFGDDGREYLRSLQASWADTVVADAIQYALQHPTRCIADQGEPDILVGYYSTKYPVVESDTKEDESPW